MRNKLLPEQRVKAIGDEMAGFLLEDVIPTRQNLVVIKKATDDPEFPTDRVISNVRAHVPVTIFIVISDPAM